MNVSDTESMSQKEYCSNHTLNRASQAVVLLSLCKVPAISMMVSPVKTTVSTISTTKRFSSGWQTVTEMLSTLVLISAPNWHWKFAQPILREVLDTLTVPQTKREWLSVQNNIERRIRWEWNCACKRELGLPHSDGTWIPELIQFWNNSSCVLPIFKRIALYTNR